MTPPPCTCGKTATGLVVEGRMHPYCAWQAERARAEALVAALEGLFAHIVDGYNPGAIHRGLRAALAADREGRA